MKIFTLMWILLICFFFSHCETYGFPGMTTVQPQRYDNFYNQNSFDDKYNSYSQKPSPQYIEPYNSNPQNVKYYQNNQNNKQNDYLQTEIREKTPNFSIGTTDKGVSYQFSVKLIFLYSTLKTIFNFGAQKMRRKKNDQFLANEKKIIL